MNGKEDLVRRAASGEVLEFVFFWGHHPSAGNEITKACLSQWFEAGFQEDDLHFPTAEHYMMFHKARVCGDMETAREILGAPDPKRAKELGRQVRGFSESLWAAHRAAVVRQGNRLKFGQNHALGRFLRSTGRIVLVEAAPNDPIWGIGLAEADPRARQPAAWPGLNLLGTALMEVRDELSSRP